MKGSYYQRNKEAVKATNNRWREANRDKVRLSNKQWRGRNKEQHRKQDREQKIRVRLRIWDEFFEHYGHTCDCCGLDDERFLTVDHVGGIQDHQVSAGGFRQTGPAAIHQAKKDGWPDTYRALCFNCNCAASRNNGVCPHVDDRDEAEL